MANIFEQAARCKLRIMTDFGQLHVEDLWDLPLKSTKQGRCLDSIAVALHSKLQNSSVSFVDDASPGDVDAQLMFDIVKHIIGVKKQERDAAAEAKAKSDRKQKLLGILARKEDAALEGMTVEELRALIEQT